jgi:hypothetical protein
VAIPPRVSWIDELVASGAAVVVATHDLDPFAPRARHAIGFDGPEPRAFALPSPADARREVLENIARQRPGRSIEGS